MNFQKWRLSQRQFRQQGNTVKVLIEVYNSWFNKELQNFKSDLFYQSRDYLRLCYNEGEIVKG